MPTVTANGIEIFYNEQGSGPPLLLIMGITAPGAVWEKHTAYWSRFFRCIMPDNRGVGQSSSPEGPYTSAQMADDLAGLLEAMEIGQVSVVGCSMGSTIAQQLAIRHPHKVKALVLMCPWARCDARTAAIFQHIVDCKAGLDAASVSLFIQLLIYSKGFWDEASNAALLERSRAEAADTPSVQSLTGLKGQAAACISHDVLKELPGIMQPTLIIGGREDIFTPPWMAADLLAHLPNASMHLYEGCGHAFHWEVLDQFNERVANWLSSLEAQRQHL